MSKSDIIERDLCPAADVQNNTMKEIEVKIDENSSVKVLLINYEDEFSCLGSKSTHYGTPLINGVLYKDRIRCMTDGTCFNVITGNIADYPGPDCLPKFKVFVDNNGMVKLSATRQELESTARLRKEIKVTERFERPKGSASMQRPKTSLLNRAGSANTRKPLQVVPKEALETIQKNKKQKCLIIGSGSAGLICADTLREYGFSTDSGCIVVLSKDSQLPYDRPQLSKKLDINIESVCVRDKQYFNKNNIEFRSNEEVESVDFNKKIVSCKSGEIYEYDKLIISTGLRPKGMPDKPGHDSKGIFTLHSFDDFTAVITYFKELTDTRSGSQINVVFLGGSYISMESVCYFIEKQAKCTIVSRTKPLENKFGAEIADKLMEFHESKGVQFAINNNLDVKEFKQSDGNVSGIELVSGENYSCDICILALGGEPCTEFLKNTKVNLTSDQLVIVDKNMKTNLNDVYAAGDITSFPKSCLGGFNKDSDNVNITHWGMAAQQGRIAALSIVNKTRTDQIPESDLNHIPFYWSTQFGKSLRFSGYNDKYESVVFHQDSKDQTGLKSVAFYIKKKQVVGVCTLDWDPICAVYAEAMFNKIEVRKEHIENDPNAIKKLLLV